MESGGLGLVNKVVTKVGKARVIRCQMIIPINWRHFHTESHCCDDDWGQLEVRGGILGEKTFYINLKIQD